MVRARVLKARGIQPIIRAIYNLYIDSTKFVSRSPKGYG